MPAFLGALAQQAAGQATGGAIAMGLQRLGVNYDNRKQAQQAQRLQDIQISGEKQLMDFQQQKQMEMWENTNYDAQKNQMKKAGINPALLYGGGGAGGTTIGGGVPAVSGGGAASPETAKAGVQGMGMMNSAQLQLMQAQAKNLDANSQKTLAEIPNVSKTGANLEADTAVKSQTVKNLIAGVTNTTAQTGLINAQKRLTTFQGDITEETMDNVIKQSYSNWQKAIGEANQALTQGEVDKATIPDKIKILQRSAIGEMLRNVLTKAQTEKTNQDTETAKESVKQMEAQIDKMTQDVMQGWNAIDVDTERNRIIETLGKWGIAVEGGKAVLDAVKDIMGGKFSIPKKPGKIGFK